jgi:hypothetical protein
MSDGGDYVFLGVTDRNHFAANSDSFDTGWSSQVGIAVGLSDSDGTPTSGQSPMLGISRRATYPSLCTNWVEKSFNGHGGRTTYGYFIVYGKVI